MFIPVLLERYAGRCVGEGGFGHPLGAGLFAGKTELSLILREDVPLAMNTSRGSLDLSSSGANVDVAMWVPVTLTL